MTEKIQKETEKRHALEVQLKKAKREANEENETARKNVSEMKTRLDRLEQDLGKLVEEEQQQEEVHFPIVEGGTPTNRYFSGKGTVRDH